MLVALGTLRENVKVATSWYGDGPRSVPGRALECSLVVVMASVWKAPDYSAGVPSRITVDRWSSRTRRPAPQDDGPPHWAKWENLYLLDCSICSLRLREAVPRAMYQAV
jgi:hypothetical protein